MTWLGRLSCTFVLFGVGCASSASPASAPRVSVPPPALTEPTLARESLGSRIGLPRRFRATLWSGGDLKVEPWLNPTGPVPATLTELEEWAGAEAETFAAPEDFYGLHLEAGVSVQEFASLADSFARRDFVHFALSSGNVELEVYSGAVPERAVKSDGSGLLTLNLAIEGRTLYATAVDSAGSTEEPWSDGSFALDAPERKRELPQYLRRVCAHERRPCDRVALIGLGDGPIAPFVEALSEVRRLTPERPLVIAVQPTKKPGEAERFRFHGSDYFLRAEGLEEGGC